MKNYAFEVEEVHFGRVVSSVFSAPRGPVDLHPTLHLHHYTGDRRLLCELKRDVSCYQIATRESSPAIQEVEMDFEVFYRLLEHCVTPVEVKWKPNYSIFQKERSFVSPAA